MDLKSDSSGRGWLHIDPGQSESGSTLGAPYRDHAAPVTSCSSQVGSSRHRDNFHARQHVVLSAC